MLLGAGLRSACALVPRAHGKGAPSSLVHFERAARAHPTGTAYADGLSRPCSRPHRPRRARASTQQPPGPPPPVAQPPSNRAPHGALSVVPLLLTVPLTVLP
ncbi:hypothetical protein [Streptomyces sp. NPDC020742]|uniref:hypothetical protein n=1 Tax=Streptomyces sp. NPDC020742 TaxID=3154897 RepID=UPI0033EF1766